MATAGPAAAAPGAAPLDPNSPAQKEYGIPLGVARSTGQSPSAAGTTGTQLFGLGISAAGGSARSAAPGAATWPEAPGRVGGPTLSASFPSQRATPGPSSGGAASSAAAAESVLGRSGSSGLSWMLVVAGVVLALGVLAGGLLTRLHGRTSVTT